MYPSEVERVLSFAASVLDGEEPPQDLTWSKTCWPKNLLGVSLVLTLLVRGHYLHKIVYEAECAGGCTGKKKLVTWLVLKAWILSLIATIPEDEDGLTTID